MLFKMSPQLLQQESAKPTPGISWRSRLDGQPRNCKFSPSNWAGGQRYFHRYPIFPRLQGSNQLKYNFQILIHPQYSVGGNLHYDVCLLKLDKPISFPDHPNVSDLVFLPESQKFLSDPGLIIGLSLCHYVTKVVGTWCWNSNWYCVTQLKLYTF